MRLDHLKDKIDKYFELYYDFPADLPFPVTASRFYGLAYKIQSLAKSYPINWDHMLSRSEIIELDRDIDIVISDLLQK